MQFYARKRQLHLNVFSQSYVEDIGLKALPQTCQDLYNAFCWLDDTLLVFRRRSVSQLTGKQFDLESFKTINAVNSRLFSHKWEGGELFIDRDLTTIRLTELR